MTAISGNCPSSVRKKWNEGLKQKAAEAYHKVEKFVEKHFAAIAFIFSSLLLLGTGPIGFFIGCAAGIAIHRLLSPKLRVQTGERRIPILNATIAVVGAMAALIQMTPAGLLGGLIFRSIPFLATLIVGSTCYRISRSF